jgi:hypothetical protein
MQTCVSGSQLTGRAVEEVVSVEVISQTWHERTHSHTHTNTHTRTRTHHTNTQTRWSLLQKAHDAGVLHLHMANVVGFGEGTQGQHGQAGPIRHAIDGRCGRGTYVVIEATRLIWQHKQQCAVRVA